MKNTVRKCVTAFCPYFGKVVNTVPQPSSPLAGRRTTDNTSRWLGLDHRIPGDVYVTRNPAFNRCFRWNNLVVVAADRSADLTARKIARTRVGRRYAIVGVHVDIGIPGFNRRNQLGDGRDSGSTLVDQIG